MKNNDKNISKNNDFNYKVVYTSSNCIKSNFEIDYTEKDGVFYPKLENIKITISIINGKYALLRLDFLKTHRKGTYTTLLTEGNLASHLAEIDKSAQEQVNTIVNALTKQNGCGEDLKATKQL